ncbi:MAG: hypothetical protein PHY25_05345, partial [Dehalococcoidales bacterium]|nr:hypothetical protein [Dehalococcoidales bacterium]
LQNIRPLLDKFLKYTYNSEFIDFYIPIQKISTDKLSLLIQASKDFVNLTTLFCLALYNKKFLEIVKSGNPKEIPELSIVRKMSYASPVKITFEHVPQIIKEAHKVIRDIIPDIISLPARCFTRIQKEKEKKAKSSMNELRHVVESVKLTNKFVDEFNKLTQQLTNVTPIPPELLEKSPLSKRLLEVAIVLSDNDAKVSKFRLENTSINDKNKMQELGLVLSEEILNLLELSRYYRGTMGIAFSPLVQS